MCLHLDSSLLDAARAACVALPAAGLPPALRRLRSRGWALVAPRSLIAVAVGPVAWSAGAETLAWVALVLVPPGSALALGWASHGGRAWLAVLVLPLLAGALAVPDAPVGEWVRIALIAGAAVIAARLVAGAARISLLQAGVVAIAVIDATFIFGDLAEH